MERNDSSTVTEFRACGDYSGTPRSFPASEHRHIAEADAGSMTQADRVWIEQREVVLGPWTTASPGERTEQDRRANRLVCRLGPRDAKSRKDRPS